MVARATWDIRGQSLMKDGRVLVTYYFNQKDGIRHIAGSILQV